MSHEAVYPPHPWDQFGTPPPFGLSYEAVAEVGATGEAQAKIADLIEEAVEASRSADDLEEDARQERDRADELLDEARELVEGFRSLAPTTADELLRKIDAVPI